MDDDEFENERRRAHLEGPVQTAFAVLRCIAADDANGAWQLFAPDLKRDVTQRWVFVDNLERLEWAPDGSFRSLELLVEQIISAGNAAPWSRADPGATLWIEMMETILGNIRQYFFPFDWVAQLEAGTLGAATATRPVPPNLECVVLATTPGIPVLYTEPTEIEAGLILLEPTVDGWLVNSFTPPQSASS